MIKKSIAFLLLIWALVACQGSVDTSQPPEIYYGEDICTECGMIISEPKYAAAYYTQDGDARGFDDIGNMCLYHTKHQEDVATFWVHDFDTEAWLSAEEAYFVMSMDIHTPMGHGIVAFSDLPRAEGLASQLDDPMVMSFTDLMAHYSEFDMEPDHDTHEHDNK